MRNHIPAVYLLSCRDNIIKVGIAKNPERRMNDIQGNCPFRLTLKSFFRPDDVAMEEAALHSALRPWGLHGEWFQVSDEMGATLESYFRFRRKRRGNLSLTEYMLGLDGPAGAEDEMEGMRPEDNGVQAARFQRSPKRHIL